MTDYIEVYGAREHNLKNIDVTIPRNRLTVITGLSGSGKSSLAFDTIYAEGQRRYIETLSAYARQFLGTMERPDVDKITGLSPVISIEQKTTNKNPRSTVGTITEIYDFMRLLYARAGDAYSYNTGEKMVKYTDDQIIDRIIESFSGKKVYFLAPLVKGRKGHYKELLENILKKGYLHARIDGKIVEIKHQMKLDRYKNHFIEMVADKLVVDPADRKRLRMALDQAMKSGRGTMMVLEYDSDTPRYFSRQLMCPTTGLSYSEPAPHNFSFNSPQGACHSCNGLGEITEIDHNKIIPNPKLSIRKGGIAPLGPYKNTLLFWQLEAIAEKYGFSLNTPVEEIDEEAINVILYGSEESFKLSNTPLGPSSNYILSFDGILNYLASYQKDPDSDKPTENQQYLKKIVCPECHGARLNREALHFRVGNKNIAELCMLDLGELARWFDTTDKSFTDRQQKIATEILKEIRTRLGFLLAVGLDYLSLNRAAATLSGGESQRIRLATQIGSQLVNVLYILDEPSIGLHQRDNMRLIGALKDLRDKSNSVIVVEHDREMILAADYVIDLGPYAGRNGGKVIVQGPPDKITESCSLTAQYLNNTKQVPLPATRRTGNGKFLALKGASGNNLRDVSVKFPLGTFICVTGVSGSGKSTLIYDTLYPILSQHLYRSHTSPMPYQSVEGLEHIDKVIEVDQSPLGRTPRSNPATYTGVFSDIRKLFELTPDAKIRGFGAGRFSFNVKGGRCETCRGAGVQVIEMNFLPDVYVRCPECQGKRYNRETLEVKFKGKNIYEVLEMTINQALDFFSNMPAIHRKIRTLREVGLGYITLGQPSTTLSGGESQRIKLAAELSKKDTGKTIYILDEPTTGLHFEDTRVLLEVLHKLADKGNTIMVIEHNMDVIKSADHIIDMGPEGGSRGGMLMATGTPEEIVKISDNFTGIYLAPELKLHHQ